MFEHVVFFALIMLLANVSLELFNSIGRYEGRGGLTYVRRQRKSIYSTTKSW